MGISNLADNKTETSLQTNGLVFKLGRRRFGTRPASILGYSPQRRVKGDIGGVRMIRICFFPCS